MTRLKIILFFLLFLAFQPGCIVIPPASVGNIANVGHEAPEIRMSAIIALADKALEPGKMKVCIKALHRDDPAIRKGMCAAFFRIGPEAGKAREPLVELLSDEEEGVRTWAALALSIIDPGNVEAISSLINGLQDVENWYMYLPTCHFAGMALLEYRQIPADYAENIVEVLRNPPDLIMGEKGSANFIKKSGTYYEDVAVELMLRLEPKTTETAPLYIEAQSLIEDSSYRCDLLKCIIYDPSQPRETLAILIDFVTDPDTEVALYALEVWREMGLQSEDAFSALVDLLSDNREIIRDSVPDMLVNYGVKAIPDLVNAIRLHTGGRSAPIHAISEIGEEAMQPLLDLIDGDDIFIWQSAGRAVIQLRMKSGMPEFDRDGAWRELLMRIGLAGSGKINDGFLPMLKEDLESDDETVRWKAIFSLGKIEPVTEEVTNLLIASLGEEIGITDGNGTLGMEDFAPRLLDYIYTDDADIRAVALVWTEIDNFMPLAETVDVYINFLKHEDVRIRRLTAFQLRDHIKGNPGIFVDAVPVMIEALQDDDPEVIKHICFGLGSFETLASEALPRLWEYFKQDPGLRNEWHGEVTWARGAIIRISKEWVE